MVGATALPAAAAYGQNVPREANDMARSLVIVESPAKAKTINKYLGRDFTVKASITWPMDALTV